MVHNGAILLKQRHDCSREKFEDFSLDILKKLTVYFYMTSFCLTAVFYSRDSSGNKWLQIIVKHNCKVYSNN